MARKQRVQTLQLIGVTTTPQPLSIGVIEATSVIIQNPLSSSDDIVIGDASNQFFRVYPGKDIEIHGDNLDHGTSGYVDLSQIYVKFNSGSGNINIQFMGDWGVVT